MVLRTLKLKKKNLSNLGRSVDHSAVAEDLLLQVPISRGEQTPRVNCWVHLAASEQEAGVESLGFQQQNSAGS